MRLIMGSKLALAGLTAATSGVIAFADAPGWEKFATPQAIMAILVLIFHLGMSWQTFLDHRRRIVALEAWKDSTMRRLEDRVLTVENNCAARHDDEVKELHDARRR
jgi:hypothetical protein